MDLRQIFKNQTWWGKALGSFFGFLIAGPVGALFGLLIGHSFDRGLHLHYTKPCWQYRIEKNKAIQTVFIKNVFAVMGHLAKLDGRVSEEEIQLASAWIHDLGLHRAEKKCAQQAFTFGKSTEFSLDQTIATFYATMYQKPLLLNLFLQMQYKMLQLDGLTNPKIQAMNNILKAFNLAPMHRQNPFTEDFTYTADSAQHRQYQRATPLHQSNIQTAYSILQVPMSATRTEVKRAYRRLMSRHHPDKLIAKGYKDQQIREANEKTQKISKAFDEICKYKGW